MSGRAVGFLGDIEQGLAQTEGQVAGAQLARSKDREALLVEFGDARLEPQPGYLREDTPARLVPSLVIRQEGAGERRFGSASVDRGGQEGVLGGFRGGGQFEDIR
jgi:hypothetical protein